MTKDKALKLALDLAQNQGDVGVDEWIAAVAAIKEALAQPEQEPQKSRNEFTTRLRHLCGLFCNDHPAQHLVQSEFIRDFAPPKGKWVGLTDDEIDDCWYQSGGVTPGFARAVEAKLKEKNS